MKEEGLNSILEELTILQNRKKMNLQRTKIQISRRKIKTVLQHECQGRKSVSRKSKCSTKSNATKR